ncbi:cytidylyltransferase domain-containing protein [Algihabitans albus]|uniref:cytidylyltransferase domain-containing protein n=1 Tax=Algihabitans albus TaxID=2164067 RepID=UPI000E5DA191|nr:NTP transferase domain-containing protein [Algihabitans albus]
MTLSFEAPARRVIAIVQARLSSERLPGKVLRPLGGRPLLGHLIDRLRHVPDLDGVVLATSSEASDDPLATFAGQEGLRCYRGPLEDVASRILQAAVSDGADAFVRISGDSPLMAPEIVSWAAKLFRQQWPDLVTNVATRSFPKGQSVEILKTSTFRAAVREFETASDREHVTSFFYRHADRFRILAFARQEPLESLQLSVDCEEDFRRVETLIKRMDRPPASYGLDDIIGLLPDRSGTEVGA